MSNKDNFLKKLLIVLLVVITCLYFKQQSGFKNENTNEVNNINKIINNENNNIQNPELKNKNNNKNIISSNKQLCSNKRKCDLVEFTNGKHCLGPVRNFHQSFNHCSMRDLGWRKWWKKNVNKNNLCNTNNFQPIMKNFLKNQENTRNIYF
jgi:hypothetical protein